MIFEPLHGNVYANDPDYDQLRGRLVRQSEIVGITRDGWKVRHFVQVLDFGKPPGVTVDPEVALTPDDELFNDADAPNRAAWEANRAYKRERDAQLLEDLQVAYAQHGPMPALHIANKLGVSKGRVYPLLHQHPDIFCYLGTPRKVWGLHGQEVQPEVVKKETPLMRAMRDVLLAQGPLVALDIARTLKKHATTVAHSLANHDTWFVVVGIRPAQGHAPETRIWGVKGVHDAATR